MRSRDAHHTHISYISEHDPGPSIVLTKRTCHLGDDNDSLNVHVNPYSIETEFEASTKQTFNISESRAHPEYGVPQNFNNDFLLLKIDGVSSETPIHLNMDNAVPIVGDNNLVALGWGTTNATGAFTPPTNGILQIARNVEYISNEECGIKLESTSVTTITPDWLCTVNDGNCGADGGGPLVVPGAEDASQDLQVGIVSWGISCGQESAFPRKWPFSFLFGLHLYLTHIAY